MSLRCVARCTWRSCGVAALTARRALRWVRGAAGPDWVRADLVLADLVPALLSSPLRGSLVFDSVFALFLCVSGSFALVGPSARAPSPLGPSVARPVAGVR